MGEMDSSPTSPLPVTLTPITTIYDPKEMTFFEALVFLAKENKRITRVEWADKRVYGLLKEGMIQIHKAGEAEETTHPWIINDGDLMGEDWYVL